MDLQDLPRAALGRDPIPGPDPAGENIRYEEEFTRLEDEIGKMQSAGPAAVDWPGVVKMAASILSSRSKDLLVASWLTFALHRQEGLAGLTDGLGVLHGIMDAHWADCFPPVKRMRARVGAVEWIAERIGPTLADLTVTPENASDIVRLFEIVDGLDRVLSEKAEGQQANLGDLLRPLRNLKRDADFIATEAAKKAAAAEEEAARKAAEVEAAAAATAAPAPTPVEALPAAVPDAAPAPAAAPPAGPTAPVAAVVAATPPIAAVAVPMATGPEMDRAINALSSNVVAMAKAIRTASPGDPRSYLLVRSVLWLSVDAPPPDQGGRTMLPDSTRSLGPILAGLAQGGDPLGLLEFCESNVVDNLFWLDLHRHAAAALDALGYTAARAALVGQVAAFLKRFPTISELAFDSGTPFADGATRMWISDELMPAGGGGSSDGLGAELDAARSEARALAAKGKLGDAAAVFEEARKGAAGERARFLWDLEKARLCIDSGRSDLAMPLLTHLDRLARQVSLDAWDPDVCIDLTILLLRGDAQWLPAVPDADHSALRREWETRLSRLDMRAAVDLVRPQVEAGTG